MLSVYSMTRCAIALTHWIATRKGSPVHSTVVCLKTGMNMNHVEHDELGSNVGLPGGLSDSYQPLDIHSYL